ncbi:MAG: group 1 glycosyl transferase [Candidatus Gottesmanbacteria bacterium GW2011_GWA2_43_14]|uniref:Group 1 glycosyl transferase n=1 Tax=Candidatus Gottesmanbacteria bacterium GW2011_GWA2_43_14 TaxID=1618443 RepID=A0A0G1DIM3_9BACT|nr:MAG: group 1 glycosyl transferase [Candidatus Gottesmanbacteria bacterium GW2011_GWA2_43_14]
MKIALLAPPYLSVPPKAYGGTEKIVSLLSDGLVDRGHDVTLFATGDSLTRAKLVSIFPEELGNSGLIKGSALMPMLHFRECFRRSGEFEIIHNHAQYLPMFLSEYSQTPVVHTMHGSFYPHEVPEDKRKILKTFKGQPFISISDNQRKGLPELNFVATVYNGLDLDEYTYIEKPRGKYLLWVGRITEKKGPTEAIDTANKLGMPLVIAAALDPVDRPYFEKEIKPKVDGKKISFVGELSQTTLDDLYGNAYCTLFPISWHEPFGLVMIESMACGTPVVGFDIGSVAEVIADGKTGFVINPESGVEGMIHAVREIERIQRGDCRTHVVEKFSKEVMVEAYISAYAKIIHG